MSAWQDGFNDGKAGSRLSQARSWFDPAYAKGYRRGRSERSQAWFGLVVTTLSIGFIALITGFLGTGA